MATMRALPFAVWAIASESVRGCRATTARPSNPIDARNRQMFAKNTAMCPGVIAAVAWASASRALNRPTRQARVT